MPDQFALSRSLFMITDPEAPQDIVTRHLLAGIQGGATHVVLRRPAAPADELFDLANRLSSARDEDATWHLLVHERIDVALAAHAHGAHLPLTSIPGGAAKGLLGERRMLGISVHNREQAVAASMQGADYAMFGHVYASQSHPGEPGRGLEALRDVAEAVDIPVIAIGGITATRVDAVLAAGASGIAVIRAISDAADPEAATRELRAALDATNHSHTRRTCESHSK